MANLFLRNVSRPHSFVHLYANRVDAHSKYVAQCGARLETQNALTIAQEEAPTLWRDYLCQQCRRIERAKRNEALAAPTVAGVRSTETEIRFAFTVIKTDGEFRALAFANQGRNHYATEEEAKRQLDLLFAHNSWDKIETSIGGNPGTLRVSPIRCWKNGDAIGEIIEE